MHIRELTGYCISPRVSAVPRREEQDRRFGDYLVPLEDWSEESLEIALIGVPQDIGVSRNGGRRGAAGAPAVIRAALSKLTASDGEQMLSPEVKVCDCGMLRTEGLSLEELHREQEYVIGHLLDRGASIVILGGGHDIALPDGRALGKRVERLGIVNVDAHLDVRIPTEDGSHSGSPFRELIEDSESHLSVLVEFGTQRYAASAHHVQYVRQRGHTVWMLDDIRRCSLESALDDVTTRLDGCDGIMLSLDMDALASAFAPGVSAPANDGFQPTDVFRIIERICALPQCRLVEVVEVNPTVDIDERTARLAAYFVASAMWMFANRTNNADSSLNLWSSSHN